MQYLPHLVLENLLFIDLTRLPEQTRCHASLQRAWKPMLYTFDESKDRFMKLASPKVLQLYPLLPWLQQISKPRAGAYKITSVSGNFQIARIKQPSIDTVFFMSISFSFPVVNSSDCFLSGYH